METAQTNPAAVEGSIEREMDSIEKEMDSIEREHQGSPACTQMAEHEGGDIAVSKEENASSAKTVDVPSEETKEPQAPTKAHMSFSSVSACADALQKLLLQQSGDTVKRLIISAETLTQTTTRTETTTTTHTLPSSSAAAASSESILLSTSTHAETSVQRDTLGQEQGAAALQTQGAAPPSNSTEVARFTPKPRFIDLPLDLVYTVPKVKTRVVKYTIEAPVPGISRLVPKAFPVDTPFIVPKMTDVDVPVVMSQTFIPELEECSKIVEIPAARYVPKVIPVDVYVPRPVAIPIKTGELKQYSRPARISEELLHQLSVEMNPHLVALNHYNTQQAAKFSNVVKRSVELANALGVPPPVPERIEIDPRHPESNCTEVVDGQGFKQLLLNLGGVDLDAIDSTFQRVKREADTSQKPDVHVTTVAEDHILSVTESGKSRHFHGIPSGYTSAAFLPVTSQNRQGPPTMQSLSDGATQHTSGAPTVPGSPHSQGNSPKMLPHEVTASLCEKVSA